MSRSYATTKYPQAAAAGLLTEVPPETPDGVRTTFTFLNTPVVMVADESRVQISSADTWTYSGTTATFVVAPNFALFSMR